MPANDISSTAIWPSTAGIAPFFELSQATLAHTQTCVGKVLHVINGEHFSGAERVQQLLGKRLPQFGFAAEFACV